MPRLIGVIAVDYFAAGVVEDDRIAGPLHVFPETGERSDILYTMHAEEIAHQIARQIETARQGEPVGGVGVGFPGIIRDGIVEESPNLPQMKGQNLASLLRAAGVEYPVHILNDADAIAAGIAATRDQLDRLIRVWFLGNGIGFGRYPQPEGAGEGGHTIVTLDPKERFCQCGGLGHLEGIMGHRAMRLRFLDLEPDEVFEQAKLGDARCAAFVELWHRALAAGTANSIHMEGPGKFFITGPNAVFAQPDLIQLYLHEMVRMSPLQGSALEVVATSDEVAIVGAAVSSRRVNNLG
jgi:predicted NBD/HSP70 family sugar kinase